jgi:rsbT antagonist protein RsbS
MMEQSVGESLETFTVIQKLEDLLLVSVPRDLADSDVLRLRRQVLGDIRRFGSHWVLLDFSLVDICDSFFGRFIHTTAQMVRLMGAEVIISGLQDAVVETMVELGMTLPNVHAVLDLDDALALSRARRQVDDLLVELDTDRALGTAPGGRARTDDEDRPDLDVSGVDLPA